jgi:hypothetical protein
MDFMQNPPAHRSSQPSPFNSSTLPFTIDTLFPAGSELAVDRLTAQTIPDIHDQMRQALNDVVVPILRKRGFHGSFPHFHRRLKEHIDLLMFEFAQHGGGFIIEIGRCQPEGFTTHWGKLIPPEKVRVWNLPSKQRVRIQPVAGSGSDSWFRFDDVAADVFIRAATSVIPFIEQAERIFSDFDTVQGVA